MSSKYSEQVIEAACEAIDWAEGLVVTDALVLAVFDSLERAPWWEKVEPGYKFREGEPVRKEVNQYAEEYLVTLPFEMHIATNVTYLIDTRWTPPEPPAKPLQVGDAIETVEDLERLPVGTGIVDCFEELARKRYEQRWNYSNLSSESYGSDSIMRRAPITIVYVPKAGGSDD